MVLRFLSLAFLLGATSVAAQVPTKAPTRSAIPTVTKVDGHTGWLGFRHDAVGDSLVVLEVAPGSPADRAGLRKGDRITLIDGQRVNPTTLREKPAVPGESRTLTVRRGAEMITLSMMAVAPPPGKLMPTRAAMANADTVAREAWVLRSEMAQKATRAIPSRVDTVELRPTLAQRKLRGDSARQPTLKMLATDRDSLTRRMLVDDAAYTEIESLLAQMKRDTVGGGKMRLLADSSLYTELTRMTKQSNALLVKLTYAGALAGAEFEQLNPGLAEYFGGVAEGVFVLRVAPGTPAASAGLHPGDVIETLNGERVETIAALRTAIAESSGPLTLDVIRKGLPATVVLRKE
jgi:C-terminal processing protease CtpA/Prc